MHSHPLILSMMCKCSYTVKKEHPNKPIEAPSKPHRQKKPNVRDSISSSTKEKSIATTLVTNYDYSTPFKDSIIKNGKLKRRVTIGSNQTSSVIDEAESPPLGDEEDYIVFCFEEDGEFHVVTEDNSRSQDCSDHGYSDGSPRPHNLKVEEERFYFSPRLQSDGIRSSTRFKKEVMVQARSRVDEDMECKEMDGIKSRGMDDGLHNEEDLELSESSTECVHGSAESTASTQSGWEQILEPIEADQEIRLSSSSSGLRDDQMPNKQGDLATPPAYIKHFLSSSNKMVDDEEGAYLSPESQQEESQDINELSNNDEQSGKRSAETSDTGRSEIEEEELLEDHDESARHSSESSKSAEQSDRYSSSSFEFPALQWQWIGSPDIWPKSESPETIRFRKSKSRRVCLRLCRF